MAKQSRSNLSDRPLDSWRATKSLQTYMRRYGIATGKSESYSSQSHVISKGTQGGKILFI